MALREAQTSHTLLLEWADAAADATADADADAADAEAGATGSAVTASVWSAAEAEAAARLRVARDALEAVEPGHRAAIAARSKRPRSPSLALAVLARSRLVAHAAEHHTRDPPACSGLPPWVREGSPRRVDAEERRP